MIFLADPIIEKLENFQTFRVDAYCESYPDVIFEIILDTEPTWEQITTAVNALEQFVNKYNKRHFLRPIHYISDIDSLPDGDHPRGIYIHIDFGNCSPNALIEAVCELEKTALPIFRIALQ